MRRRMFALVLCFAACLGATADIADAGNCPTRCAVLFGSKGGIPIVIVTGKVLMVDNVSHILLVDGVSKLCRAGGC